MAMVNYDFQNLGQPILTVEEAVKQSSYFEVPPQLSPRQVGDFSKGMAEADHKILSAEVLFLEILIVNNGACYLIYLLFLFMQIILGSQYYFYMETQTALAVPDEDNCMVVYSSTQCPEFLHSIIAKCLGVPENNVRVITRRVGGGFGGKGQRSMPVCKPYTLFILIPDMSLVS